MPASFIGAANRSFLAGLWRLTKPYWSAEERWIARGLLCVVVALNFGDVATSVWYNYWNQAFFNAIQDKNEARFWHEMLIFCPLATISIVIDVYRAYLMQMLVIRWRRWLTDRYLGNWLANRVYYRMELTSRGTDNPDQRIQEDLNNFATQSLSLSINFINQATTLLSFLTILWRLSGAFSFAIAGSSVSIPGYMLWVAVLYSGGGSWLTQVIGRRLAALRFQQQRFEADFRFSLIRLRENAEGVALYRGETDERTRLWDRFSQVVANWYQVMLLNKRLNWFINFYSTLAGVFPYVVASPHYFSGIITLGVLTQTADAFGQVQGALSWFINVYTDLADWKASVDRLISFDQAIAKAEAAGADGAGIALGEARGDDLEIEKLDLGLPDGRTLISGIDAEVAPGDRLLVSGPSGSGKSTLLRAIAGIWPYGAGRILLPRLKRLLFLPQKPYVPIGSLRHAVTFPAAPGSFSDADIAEALKTCRLPDYAGRLDEFHHWDRRLSPGEQQRLAFARALLQRPDWLFLDEATSSLDPETEAYLYGLLEKRLPGTTLVSVAHRQSLEAFHRRRLHFKPAAGGTVVASEPLA
ncbi:MAG TPA: ABC transporter ATP-binding protein/permease [Candidatus Udaeobacter sp.]|nr:ABC transporter ATP-binding protein/permease [Candidatus Udaeobacter sp.]